MSYTSSYNSQIADKYSDLKPLLEPIEFIKFQIFAKWIRKKTSVEDMQTLEQQSLS